jgi:beta-glucosidase
MTTVHQRLFNDLFPRALHKGVLDAIIKKIAIPEAANTQDFLGLNFYTRDKVGLNLLAPGQLFARRFFPKDALLSESGSIAHAPEGMVACVRWGHQFGVPMIITENGVDDAEDTLRPQFILEHLHALWRVINDNYLVEGYFHWTLVDNFEWERGWTQRFGLWYLDLETQARIRRPSADLYAEICRTNGISFEAVEKYAPQVLKILFP